METHTAAGVSTNGAVAWQFPRQPGIPSRLAGLLTERPQDEHPGAVSFRLWPRSYSALKGEGIWFWRRVDPLVSNRNIANLKPRSASPGGASFIWNASASASALFWLSRI